MTYRDEAEVHRARIDELEARVAELEAENAALKASPTHVTGEPNPLLGAPTRLSIEREVAVTLDASAFEEMLDTARAAVGAVGEGTVVGNTMTFRAFEPGSARMTELVVRLQPGKVCIRAHESLGNLAGALFGGLLGGLGGGGLGLLVPLAIWLARPLTAPIVLLWLIGVYALTRWAFRRAAVTRARGMSSMVDAIEGVARRHAALRASKVRVSTAEAERDDIADTEAATEHEAASGRRKA